VAVTNVYTKYTSTVSSAFGEEMREVRLYDATGERLQKIVRHNDTVRTTTYVDGLTYLNDTTLLFFAHDGGRTRRNYKGRLVNDYFIEDHLGNTRMVLTDERDTVAYLAAFESNRDAIENAVWRNRNNTREAIVNGNAFFNNPNSSNTHYSRLNGSDANRRKGPGLVLKVMAGDTLNISTRALYTATSVPNTMATVNDMVTSILTGFLGAATGNPVVDNKAWLPSNNGVVLNTNALNGFITNNQNNNSNTGAPRAYLKYLLFDEDFQLVQGFAERIDNGANTVHTYTTGGQLVVPKNGFIYVFTTNESPVDVWFDDVSVIHRTGPLLQESSFYPFGMEITPLSSYAAIKVPNERDYQKNELDEEFGLELHYFDARMYDAQVGRFGGVDPYAEKFPGLTPYNYAANNTNYFIDPDGRIIIGLAILGILKVGKIGLVGAKVLKAAKIAYMAGGTMNTARNWKNVQNVAKQRGNFMGGLKALGYFIAGGEGAAAATIMPGLGGVALGVGLSGTLNIGMDYWSGELNGKSNFGNFLQSFSEGGSSALFGKSVGKSFSKGLGLKEKKIPISEKKWIDKGLRILEKGTEKGFQSFLDSYAEYGAAATKDSKYGKRFYLQSFFAGFGAGVVDGVGDNFLTGEKGWFGKDFKKLDGFTKGIANGLLSYESTVTKTYLLSSMNKKYAEYVNKERSKIQKGFFVRGSILTTSFWAGKLNLF
jgi:RHS repeat-associated protein